MLRTTNTITLSLPLEISKKIEKLMKEEKRTRNEILKEALKRYIEEKEWKEILKYGRLKAKERGITKGQVEEIIDAYRK